MENKIRGKDDEYRQINYNDDDAILNSDDEEKYSEICVWYNECVSFFLTVIFGDTDTSFN